MNVFTVVLDFLYSWLKWQYFMNSRGVILYVQKVDAVTYDFR